MEQKRGSLAGLGARFLSGIPRHRSALNPLTRRLRHRPYVPLTGSGRIGDPPSFEHLGEGGEATVCRPLQILSAGGHIGPYPGPFVATGWVVASGFGIPNLNESWYPPSGVLSTLISLASKP